MKKKDLKIVGCNYALSDGMEFQWHRVTVIPRGLIINVSFAEKEERDESEECS